CMRDDPRRVRGSPLSSTFLPGFGCANPPGRGSDSHRADAGDCYSPTVFDLFDTCPLGSLCFLSVHHWTLKYRHPRVWFVQRFLDNKGGGECDVLSFAQLWKLQHHFQDGTWPIHLKPHLSPRGRLRADLFAWVATHRDVDLPKTRLQMNIVLLMLLLLAGTGVYSSQKAIDVRAGQFRSTEEVLYLPSGKVIKTLSLGHNGLLADVYWMRAVQYYGGKRLKNEKRFDLLDPLIGIATTLDPQLIHDYRFGAIFLSERSPVAARQPAKALALLKQGIER